MALYRTVKVSERLPNEEGDYWIISKEGKTESLYASGYSHHSRWNALVEEWLEPIEPSPDIQKRAEELFPKDLWRDTGYPFEIEETDRNEYWRDKAIQLATEAVAAEREKYEKEIEIMRERVLLAEAKIKGMKDAMIYMQQAAEAIAKL